MRRNTSRVSAGAARKCADSATFSSRPAIVPSPPAGNTGQSAAAASAATSKSLSMTGDTTSDSPAAPVTACPAAASA